MFTPQVAFPAGAASHRHADINSGGSVHVERTHRSVSSGTIDHVYRLVQDEGTLYETNPREIADMVLDALHRIERDGRGVRDIVQIPDYHTFAGDGGVKDIFFLTSPRDESAPPTDWKVSLVVEPNSTLYAQKTSVIEAALTEHLTMLQRRGHQVGHVIPLADHHNWVGRGNGEDGLKNFIVCYS